MPVDIEKLKASIQKPAAYRTEEDENRAEQVDKNEANDIVPDFELDDDGEEYMSIGIPGVLAASEKLLNISRGLEDVDERDSLKFQKVLRTHAMIRESIKMDAGKIARTAMYQAAKRKNLRGLNAGAFDSYINRMLVGNPLTSPLEEINPMQLVTNARRITKMGPGGLGSSQSITEEAQSVHPSQFGFISTLEGPESERAGIDVRAAWGTRLGSNGRIYQKFFDRKSNRYRWLSPEDLDGHVTKLPD